MICINCKTEIPDASVYCNICGKKQTAIKKVSKRSRGNGTGSVYQLPSKSWCAQKVVGKKVTDAGKVKYIYARKSGFKTKREALEALPTLTRSTQKPVLKSFQEVYEAWLPVYQRRGRSKSTENCYKAAFKYFKDIYYLPFQDIGIDDLQECIDECPHGKRTKENMKALGTLMYDFAISRRIVQDGINMASYLFVGGESGVSRFAFTDEDIKTIKNNIGKVKYADYIYSDIYLGFRPSEFIGLSVEDYNFEGRYFIAGTKTEAGTNRTVTVSPKIIDIIVSLIGERTSGPVFAAPDGSYFGIKEYRENFYLALLEMGLPTPENPDGDRKYTPHCCRHTFATLMDKAAGSVNGKLELMGHTSEKMLKRYTHPDISALKAITDNI